MGTADRGSAEESAGAALRLGWGEGSSYTTIEKTRAGEDRTVYWFVIDVGLDANNVRKRAYGRSLSSFKEAHARASENAWKRSRRIDQPRASTGGPESVRKRSVGSAKKSRLAKMTTTEYFQHWLKTGNTVSMSTKKRHQVYFSTHVEPVIGSIGIAEVTTADVEALLTTLASKKKPGSDDSWLSVGAVRNIVAPVRKMFRYAAEVDAVIDVSPFVVLSETVPTNGDNA